MSTILITGANKGLGRQAARELLEAGHDVWLATRDLERGREAADALGGRHVLLDVTDDASVDRAAAEVASATGGTLDVLINNAGTPSSFKDVDTLDAHDVEAVYAVNVFGVVRVFRAFLPLLRRAPHGVVVNVSSGLGSHEATSDPERAESRVHLPDYCSSKAAVNMLTAQWAAMVPGLRINCVDPGHTATDLGGAIGPQTVGEGVRSILAMATIGADGPTGTFSDQHGPLGW